MHDSEKPAGFMPSKKQLEYYEKLITVALLTLALPYLIKLIRSNPGKAASLTSRI